MYLTIGIATLSKHRRQFLAGAQASTHGNSSKISAATQQYISRMIPNGSLDVPRGVQEYLRSISISMSLSGAE
jgi:hypothetical protein